MSRQLHLGAFLMGVGHHASAWRLADAQPDNLTRPAYYKALAQSAERSKFDYVFFADRLAVSDRYGDNLDASVRYLTIGAAMDAEHQRQAASSSCVYAPDL